jgi:hypothetical protein
LTSIAEEISLNGFVVLEGLLPRDFMQSERAKIETELRKKGLHKSGGTVLPNAAFSGSTIRDLICNVNVVKSVRDILDSETPIFTLEADLHRNYLASGWHKDTGESVMPDGYFGLDPIGRDDCRVVKVAIYFQDHSEQGGLTVRAGSHKFTDLDTGVAQELHTRLGDIVIFDVRVTHRGLLPSVSDAAMSRLCDLMPVGDKGRVLARSRSLKNSLRHRPDRVAAYFAYGVDKPSTEIFASRNMMRQLSQLGQSVPEPDFAFKNSLRNAGLGMAELHRESGK